MKKLMILTMFSLVGFLSLSSTFAQEPAEKIDQKAELNQSKQVVLRLFDEVFNQKSFSVVDELYNPNVIDHCAFPDQAPGIEGIKSAIKGFYEIFDDVKITVEDVIAEDNRVVTRELWQVIDKKSRKTVTGSIIHIFYIHDGRISDEWSKGWNWLDKI